MGGGGINTYDQRRDIRIGSLSRIATGKSTGSQFGGSFEGGVRLEGGKIEITPYLRFGYLKLHQNGYSEKNGGAGIDQTQSARDNQSLRGTIGLNLERDFALYYDSMLETDFRVSYTREFKNDPTVFTSRFSSAGTPFQIISQQHGPNVYAVGFGIGHRDSFSSVTFDYDAEFIGGLTSHIATVTLRFRF
jgi:outer membrane autotransporter protein